MTKILPLHKALREQVADGRKTQTRLVIKRLPPVMDSTIDMNRFRIVGFVNGFLHFEDTRNKTECFGVKPKLKVGEIFLFEGVDIDLRCTAIRAERLQEISEEDCEAEGVRASNGYNPEWNCPTVGFTSGEIIGHCVRDTAIQAFESTWRHIYPDGPKSWESNPPVFVYTYEKEDWDE